MCVLLYVYVCVSWSSYSTGYFSQISTLADVQENVMRYLHVMSRPKVIDHEHDTVWTEAYIDSTVSQVFFSVVSVCVCASLYECVFVSVCMSVCACVCVCVRVY